jgi:hypothetical protein
MHTDTRGKGMQAKDYPDMEPRTLWRHRNGAHYIIMCFANEPEDGEEERPGHPLHVIYRNARTAKLYTRAASDWHRSMTKVELPDAG